MEPEHLGVDEEYLKNGRYEAVAQDSQRRNILYDNYLEMVEKFYVALREFYEETEDVCRLNMQDKNIYLIEFEEFLSKISSIIKQTSVFQIDCITEFRMNNMESTILEARDGITSKFPAYLKCQKSFRSRQVELQSVKSEAMKSFQILKNDAREPNNYYNVRLMKGKVRKVEQKLSEIREMENNLSLSQEHVLNNAEEFESNLFQFRKKLFQNKYQVLTKMVDKSRHFRNCLTEIVLYLLDCINLKLGNFRTLIKASQESAHSMMTSHSRKSRDQKLQITYNSALNLINSYNSTLDALEKILHTLDQAFKNLHTKFRKNIELNKPSLMENLNMLYTIEENPSKEINDILNLYELFGDKMNAISDQLYICSTKLALLKTNVKKHSDVTLSLLRVSISKGRGAEENRPSQLDELNSQLSNDYIAEIILEVFKSFKEVQNEIKNFMASKYLKKKKKTLENSMDLSHLEETMFQPKRKPCKNEAWLWKEWRDKNEYTFLKSNDFIQEVEKFIQQFQEIPESPELSRYECLNSKNDRGLLKVCEKYLEFTRFSQNGQSTITIPYSKVTDVTVAVYVFEKALMIHTEMGNLTFSKIPDVESARQFIQEKVDAGNSMGVKVLKKTTVELLPEQIAFLQANKQSREAARPKADGKTPLASTFISNITIDQVYDVLYSDKPFVLMGKPEVSFFAYSSKKMKNYNFEMSKWDSSGPEFYSQDPEVKFHTAPLFSTRTSDQDHPLPYIPFMPRNCHVKEVAKIYWISQEELDLLSTTQTLGVPFAETFHVEVLHQIQKKDDGVQISLFGAAYFTKDTSMKGILKSTTDKETLAGCQAMVSDAEKVLKIYLNRKSGGGEASSQKDESKVMEDVESEKPQQKEGAGGILNSQNKLIVGCILVGFLLNALLRMILG